MKRIATLTTLIVILVCLLGPIDDAKPKKKKSIGKKSSITCPGSLNDIYDCLDTGCGPALDPNLNIRKNTTSKNAQGKERWLDGNNG